MKKSDFYNELKIAVKFLSGLSGEAWCKVGGDIVVQTTSGRLVVVNCHRNIVTLYTKLDGEKGETVVTDYNKHYRDYMVTLTTGKIYRFLTA